ncbi:MAG: molecular chaperone TorD family protein [Deltaproteobacteria bacterium]|nr:molecular chaperone TorD family protein [Deltaproteobacteria bacterium]
MNVFRALTYLSLFPTDEMIKLWPDVVDFLLENAQEKELIRELSQQIKEENAENLRIEYTRLFISSYPELPVSPYESTYITKEKRVMADCVDDITDMYKKAGLELKEDFPDLPDHFSVELSFLDYLEEKKLYKQKQEFLNKHLIKWIPELNKKIKQNAKLKFYKVFFDLVEKIIANEAENK